MKVLITPRSFGQFSQRPFEILRENGIEVIENPKGQILTEQELIPLVEDIDGIILGVDPMSAKVLKNAKKLKVISKYGVGVDNIDLDYADEHNIAIERALGANSNAVADYAFTLLASVARRVVEIHEGCLVNDWSKKNALDIYGKTIGIVGFGAIGQGVAKRASGFGMNILYYDPFYDDETLGKKCDLDTILKESDFISLHLPLTQETHHLIDAKAIAKMKPNAIIINTARGGVVDEDALYIALKQRQIYGAGLDVFETEPPSKSPLITLDNVILGAHSAASTQGAVDNMGTIASENIIKHLIK